MCMNTSFAKFLDTPQFLSTTMYTITIIGLPVHIFGGLCVVFKTPTQMCNMKWPMLTLLLWSASLDLSFGFLVIPFMYQPVLAGYSLGILNGFGVPLRVMCYICVVQIAGVTVSVCVLFETRFFILYAKQSCWKHLRRPWLILNYTICVVYMIPTYLSIPDQKTGKAYQFSKYPCLPQEVYDDKVFLLTTWSTGYAYNMSLNTAVQQTLIFVFLIYWNMRKSMVEVKMSKRTLDMHRTFLKTIILQVTIPLITVMGPLMLNFFTIYNSYYNQGANNLSISMMATHGLVSSLAMIYLHKSYWATLLQILSPKFIFEDRETMMFSRVHQHPQQFS